MEFFSRLNMQRAFRSVNQIKEERINQMKGGKIALTTKHEHSYYLDDDDDVVDNISRDIR